MPCTYTGSLEGDHIMFLEKDLKESAKILTETTQAACEMAKLLTPAQFRLLAPKTKQWVINHRKVDTKRRQPK